ncbi:MAG: DUF6463 family protein [Cyanobacteria bacterium J06638_22]
MKHIEYCSTLPLGTFVSQFEAGVNMQAWIGKALFAIGVIHTLFGIIVMHETLSILVGEGLFNTVNGQPGREAVFWFLFTGFLLLIVGALINWIEQHHATLPTFLRWSFLALTLLGIIVIPISGVWLIIPCVVGIFVRASKPEEQQSTFPSGYE